MRVALVQAICPHYRVPLFAALAKRVHLTVLHGRGDPQGAGRNAERIEGFDHRELPTLRLALRRLHPYLKVSWFPGLSSALERLQPELVVSECLTTFPNALAALRYCRAARVPFVAWDSGRRPGKPMPFVRRMLEPINRRLLRGADACIAYSSVARASFLEVGVPDARIFVAQNTLDVDRILRDRERLLSAPAELRALRRELGLEGRVVILYVGAVEQRKRIDEVIELLPRLGAPGEIALLVVGDGEHLAALRRAGERSTARVVFAGRVTEGVGAYYGIADLAVLPGPGGLSINQAMAYGLPIVARGGDGTEDDLVEEGVTGFRVETRDEMEARLHTLASDRALRLRMGEAALRSIRRVDLANMCDRFVAAMDYALAVRTART